MGVPRMLASRRRELPDTAAKVPAIVKVLIVDDDADILDVTAYALRREGFTTVLASDGGQALRLWESDSPDLVLLDVRLPSLDGFEVLRTIRHDSLTPVIMVTARCEDDDVVRGLRLGADDYVTKPFSPRQLVARIRTVLRRANVQQPERGTELEEGGMVLELESRLVRRGKRQIRLTPIEFRIVQLLMLNAGRVVPGARLLEHAWGLEGGEPALLQTHVSHIRGKLGLKRGAPGYIEGIPSLGYVLHR